MPDTTMPPAPSPLWPRVNLGIFVVAHLLLVLGLRYTYSTFISLVAGIVAGLAAFAVWRMRPELWRQATTAAILAGTILMEIIGFSILMTPPPPPPPLTITKAPDGTWRFNRGGDVLVGRHYMALPEPSEASTSPMIVGVAKVTKAMTLQESGAEWVVMRRRFADRPRYRVRPLRSAEKVPDAGYFATIVEVMDEGRARIDVGRKQGLEEGVAYALHHPGVQGSGGYLVIDDVGESSATGFLVGGRAVVPHDVDRVGPVRNLINIALTRAEVAYQGGRVGDARVALQQALDLSAGTDERARERLSRLPPASGQSP